MDLTYEMMRPEDAEETGTLMCQALHFKIPDGQMVQWMERRGLEKFRVVRADGRIAAMLAIIPMGQYFGGAALPMLGLSPVGVAPEYRGRKVGAYLMREFLKETASAGVPLSTLYPATINFYRSFGYERAGSRTLHELPPGSIQVREREATLVPSDSLEEADYAALYDPWAAQQPGFLARSTQMWDRILRPLTAKPFRYWVVDGAGERIGYLVYIQGSQFEELKVFDWCAQTPAAARAILNFLANHETLVSKIVYPGAAAADTLLHLMPHERSTVNWHMDWMLRIVDVPGALAARGYLPGVAAELHMAISDGLLEANDGAWVVRIADGRATVERGGKGTIRLRIQDLAVLFSGFMAPHELALAGKLDASAADLAALALAFAGPRPWMIDMF